MKKGLYAALLSAYVNSCAPPYAPPPDLPSSVTQISKPEETQQWLQAVLTYEHDDVLYRRGDFWAPCALTYQLKKGDCEDYAICAAAILQQDVDQGFIVTAYRSKPESAHAVFVYQLHGKWGMISNDTSQFRSARFATLEAVVVDSLSESYDRYIVHDYRGLDLINGNENLKGKMIDIYEQSFDRK